MTDQTRQVPAVLIIDLAKRYGGAEVRVLDTAKALHGRYPYTVATLTGSPLHQRLEAADLSSLPVPFARSDPRLLLFLWRAIRQKGYRVVDAHNVQSQFWGQLVATLTGGTTKVSTVHSAYRIEHNGSLKGRLYEQVLRLNRWWGGRFIAVSEAVYAYLRDAGIPSERITLIHNSIELPSLTNETIKQPLLKSLGWPEDAYVVIVVARLEPVKGHPFLIEAMSQLVETQPRLRCLIVGEGRTRTALETQVAKENLQDRVHFTGFRDDIPALLRASDLFCLPSLSEGLPYALLEAAAHRVPLLVTRVGGMADLLTHKQTAFLVPPSDPAALVEGLNWFIEHPQEASIMGQRAYEQVEKLFSVEEMITKTLDIYRCPINGKSATGGKQNGV